MFLNSDSWWHDGPGWLLPAVLIIFIVAVSAVAVLLVMWGTARRKTSGELPSKAQEKGKKPPRDPR